MLKRSILLATAAAALLAFTASAASANGALITTAEGEPAKTITATSSNMSIVLSTGSTQCRTALLHLNVSTNEETTAGGHGTGTMEGTVGADTHTGHCGGTAGPPIVDVLGVTISDLHLESHGGKTTGTVDFAYTYQATFSSGTSHCTFAGTNVPVTRTGLNSININGSLKLAGGASCWFTGTINGDFTIFDENGEPVHIH